MSHEPMVKSCRINKTFRPQMGGPSARPYAATVPYCRIRRGYPQGSPSVAPLRALCPLHSSLFSNNKLTSSVSKRAPASALASYFLYPSTLSFQSFIRTFPWRIKLTVLAMHS